MEKLYFLDQPSRVLPSSPLEIDILRQVILADRFVIDDEIPYELRGLAIRGGGRLFYDPEWSAEFVMHYVAGAHLGGGKFELTVTLYSAQTCKSVGTLELGSALATSAVPHDVQTAFYPGYWRRTRSTFFLPMWFLLPDREPSADLRIKTHEKAAWRLLAFEEFLQESSACDNLPHVVLVEPEKAINGR